MAKSSARRLPLIPTRELVVFPGMMIPLQIGRRASLAALDAAIGATHELVLVAQREAGQERIASLDDLHATGTLVSVAQVVTSDDSNTVRAILTGIARVTISELAMEDGFLSVTATPIPATPVEMTPEIDALIDTVRESLYEYAEAGSPLTADAIETGLKTEDPSAVSGEPASVYS